MRIALTLNKKREKNNCKIGKKKYIHLSLPVSYTCKWICIGYGCDVSSPTKC